MRLACAGRRGDGAALIIAVGSDMAMLKNHRVDCDLGQGKSVRRKVVRKRLKSMGFARTIMRPLGGAVILQPKRSAT
jgi:hypothetical protein